MQQPFFTFSDHGEVLHIHKSTFYLVAMVCLYAFQEGNIF